MTNSDFKGLWRWSYRYASDEVVGVGYRGVGGLQDGQTDRPKTKKKEKLKKKHERAGR